MFVLTILKSDYSYFAVFFCGLSYRLIIVATKGYVKPDYQVKNSNFRKEIVDRNGNL